MYKLVLAFLVLALAACFTPIVAYGDGDIRAIIDDNKVAFAGQNYTVAYDITHELVGVWIWEGRPRYTFRADGQGVHVFVDTSVGFPQPNVYVDFVWRTDNGILYIYFDELPDRRYYYKVDNPMLELIVEDRMFLFYREGTTGIGLIYAPEIPKNAHPLVGVWNSGGSPWIRLDADGTGMRFYRNPIRWRTYNDVLFMYGQGTVDTRYYVIDGNILHLTRLGSTGVSLSHTRSHIGMEEGRRAGIQHMTQGASTAPADIDLQTIEMFVFSIGSSSRGHALAIDRRNDKVYFDPRAGSFGESIWWFEHVPYSADFTEEDLAQLIQAIEQSNLRDWPEHTDSDNGGSYNLTVSMQFSDGTILRRSVSDFWLNPFLRQDELSISIGALNNFIITLGAEIQKHHMLETAANNQDFVIVNSRALAPVAFFEALGFEVSCEPITQSITLSKRDHVVVISVDAFVLTSNSAEIPLDVSAQIIDGREMLPIRALLESVGYHVHWNADKQTVSWITDALRGITAEDLIGVWRTEDFESGILSLSRQEREYAAIYIAEPGRLNLLITRLTASSRWTNYWSFDYKIEGNQIVLIPPEPSIEVFQMSLLDNGNIQLDMWREIRSGQPLHFTSFVFYHAFDEAPFGWTDEDRLAMSETNARIWQEIGAFAEQFGEVLGFLVQPGVVSNLPGISFRIEDTNFGIEFSGKSPTPTRRQRHIHIPESYTLHADLVAVSESANGNFVLYHSYNHHVPHCFYDGRKDNSMPREWIEIFRNLDDFIDWDDLII